MTIDVVIADSWARDGLQTLRHEPRLRSPTTSEKVEMIRLLDQAGVPEIEITGFVHPRVVPSLQDAEEVALRVSELELKASIRALVPNLKGADRALSVGVQRLNVLIVASDTYQTLNSNMTVEQNLREIERIVARTEDVAQISVGIGTAFVCPYEGPIGTEVILQLIDRLTSLGIIEITLADSIGLATPKFLETRIADVQRRFKDVVLGVHLHDLAGLGLTCARAAAAAGVKRFDGVAGGLGGGIALPLSSLVTPNVATEDLVFLMEAEGLSTGIGQEPISEVGWQARCLVGAGAGHLSSFGSPEMLRTRALDHLAGLSGKPGDSSPNVEIHDGGSKPSNLLED